MPFVMSRRSKALTLAPLALLSGLWTASTYSTSATAGDPATAATSLPDGTSVPTEAIQAPASVPSPGAIAAAVPLGAADAAVENASANGIPAPALSAYQRAAQIINSADAGCQMPWELLAAVGRVESDHGRYGGSTLTEDGLSEPGIYGIALDGSNGTAVIKDTDGGLLDNDEVYDRAVGPMQFIPSTWQVVKVDANGDGERNPQDVNDAALAAAVYLCSGDDDLASRSGQEAALFRYNRSDDYVQLVLRLMEAYSAGDFTAVPSGTQGGTTFTPSYTSSIGGSYAAKQQRERRERAEKRREQREQSAGNGGSASGGSTSGGSSSGGSSSGGASGGGGVTDPPGTGGGAGSGSAGGQVKDTVDKVVKDTTKGAGGAVKDTGDAVGDVVDEVGEATGGDQGGGQVTEPVSKTVRCLAEVGASTIESLSLAQLARFNACMAS